MLTVATAALLSGPALAQTDITTKVTTPQSTSADGTITIESNGSIVITTNPTTGPAVTLDGGTTPGTAADVYNLGTISYVGVGDATTPLTGILMLGGNTGGLDNAAKIDFTGTGSYKTGILISAGTGSFIGDIMCTQDSQDCSGDANSKGTPLSQLIGVQDTNVAAILLESGGTLKIQGDNSTAIDIAQGATLGDVCANCASDIDIAGEILMTPSSSSSTSSIANGIYIAGTMNGDINIIQGGEISVEGTNSYGINMIAPNSATNTPGGVLNGNIAIDGEIIMSPISTTATNEGANVGMYLGGTINGNIDIETSGRVSSSGQGAEGIVIAGPLNGFFENQGVLNSFGVAVPSNTGNNPEAGSALVVNASVSGGIFNAGPVSTNDPSDPTATITTGGNEPTVLIAPISTSTSGITIGGYTSAGETASFFNRGTISNGSANPNPSSFVPTALEIMGISPTYNVDLTNGIYNSGSISSSGFTDSKGSSTDSVIDIIIGRYATVTSLTNADDNTSAPGNISANISGVEGGRAIAIDIQQSASLPSLINDGTIIASAQTTNTELTSGAVQATAIADGSGTLTSIINNTGATIAAFATKLTDNSQIDVAIDVSHNIYSATTPGVTIQNFGTIDGDVLFGSGNDVFLIQGNASNAQATVTGNVYFGGNSVGGTGVDALTIANYGTFTGQLYSGSQTDKTLGMVNVTVEANGTLNLLTADNSTSDTGQQVLTEGTTLNAGNFDLNSGSTVDIHYSQAFALNNFPTAVLINAATEATIDTTDVTFTPDSFIAPPVGETSVTVDILNSPSLNISPSTLSSIQAKFLQTLSYLYSPLESGLSLNGAGDELLLTITPKTIGADGCKTKNQVDGCNLNTIPLNGYAAKLFPYVNVALGNDNALGAAVINSVSNFYTAQNTYTEFAPDVSGATRALAISLTDDATSVVAARQKELREYANQEGDLTLWGQQFVERLNQDGTSAGPGYRNTGFGFAMGLDEGDPVIGRYGAAFTFYSGDARETEPAISKTTSEWYILTGYTDWHGKGLFLDTDLSLGYADLKGNRYLDLQVPNGIGGFTNFSRDAIEHHPGEFVSGGVTTGVAFDEGGTVIAPQFSLNGLAMREEPYSESGGGNGMDLHVASSYEQSLRAFTGVDVRQDFDFTDFLLQPDLTVGYRYDIANGAQSLKAEFESVQPPTVFEITGPKPDKGNIVAQGGLAVSTGAWSLGLSFDYLKAGSGNTAEEGTITLLGRI
jgi:hypothetical protein